MREGPTLLVMILLSLILFFGSAVIWLRRPEPRKWLSIHIVATVVFVQSAWGTAWLLYGLNYWNGFIAPIPLVLEVFVKLLSLMLKAM